MRRIVMAGAVAVAALAAACAPRTMETTPPSVSLAYDDPEEYDEAAGEAAEYCAETYGSEAMLLEREPTGDGGYRATFTCE